MTERPESPAMLLMRERAKTLAAIELYLDYLDAQRVHRPATGP